jgi:DnaJ like chaperone protein
LVGLIAGGVIANRNAARAKKESAKTTRKPKAVVYHDYGQYQQACQAWARESNLFVQQEAARLAALEIKLKEGGPLSGLGCLGFIIGAPLLGTVFGAESGWGTLIVGVFVVGLLAGCEQQYRRWRWREQLKPRVFANVLPEPTYEGPPPRQQHPPPPRQEQPPPRKSTPQSSSTEPVRVTSLRQAFEILDLPPGRIALSVARAAYRTRMAEYHPDKTMHLGKELQELAARKALEINLAIKFIEENCTRFFTA